jgi:amino acid transporter
MLHTPRLTFTMGEEGDFPAFFAAVHPRFRSLYASILTFAVLVVISQSWAAINRMQSCRLYHDS